MKKIGPNCMIWILFAVIMRMFLPFEFSYTYSWYIAEILSPIRDLLIYPIIKAPVEIIVWHLLVGLWVVGIAYHLIRKLYNYYRVIRCISLLPQESWENLCEEHHLDISQYPDIAKLNVICSRLFRSPYLVGFKKPYLVLPDREYSDADFHYIVLHELMHLRNKDIAWKVIIDLLCVAFWWNPVIYLLKKELFQLIEMRNDMQIFSMVSEEEKIGYMECLKSTAVDLAGKDMAFGVSFCRNDLKALKRRMQLMVEDNRFSRIMQTVLSVLCCLMLVFTSMIVIEPYSLRDIPEEEGTPITSDNAYLIQKGDQYDVYVNDTYVMTVDDLLGFDGIEIYESLEELPV